MAFSTNVDSTSGFPDGGLFLSQSTNLRQVLLDIRDEIVGDSESRWEEVTGSSPTPTEIQPFASTVNSTNVTDGGRGSSHHVTLYLADDSGLSRSNNSGARLLRFWRSEYGIQVGILDTVQTENANVNSGYWTFLNGNPNSSNFNTDEDRVERVTLGNVYKNNGGDILDNDALSTDQGLEQDTKFFYSLDDEFIWFNSYYVERTRGFAGMGAYVYHPSPPANGTISRKDEPHIWYVRAGSAYFTNNRIYRPQSRNQGRQSKGFTRPFIQAGAEDFQNRHIYSEVWAANEGNANRNFYFDKFVPGARIVGRNAFPDTDESQDFRNITLNGTTYGVVGGLNGDPKFLVQIAS